MRGSRLQWLYPGLGIKRWVLLIVAGTLLACYSALVLLGLVASAHVRQDLGLWWVDGHPLRVAAPAAVGLLLGGVALGAGLLRLFRFSRPAGGVQEIRSTARLARGPRVVAIGGGTGLSALLSGLKRSTSNLTAIVTVARSHPPGHVATFDTDFRGVDGVIVVPV